MYVHEIAVRNFSIHKHTRLTLHPITVFVGPNGGGKSALFDALLNFSMLARGKIGQAFGLYPSPYSFAATRWRRAPSIGRISFEVVLSESQASVERLHYKVDYSQQMGSETSVPQFQIHTEALERLPTKEVVFDRNDPDDSRLPAATAYLAGDTGIFAVVRKAVAAARSTFPPDIAACAREISRLNKFRLNPQNLAAASDLPDLTRADAPRISHDGGNLAAALYFAHETSDPSLAKIVAALKAVRGFENFEDFEFSPWDPQRIGFSARFDDARQSVSAPRLSDGQRLLIGLMVLVLSPARPPILLLEEPANGLTAPAQRAFYRAVHDLAFHPNAAERSQVLISSHSPFVLCEAWNGEDRDFVYQVKVEQGRAVVRSFADAVTSAGVVLGRTREGRVNLSLKNAEELMSGYLA